MRGLDSATRGQGILTWLVGGVVAFAVLAVGGCSDDDRGASAPASTTSPASTTAPSLATSSGPTGSETSAISDETVATVAGVIAVAQDLLDAEFAALPDPPPEVLGAMQIRCAESGVVRVGDLFACESEVQAAPGFDLEEPGFLFAVLDDDGTAAWAGGTDLPSNRDGLDRLAAVVPPGLFCRDLVDPDTDVAFFSAVGTNPQFGYFLSVVYWFLEGRPARMDADGNGIPCETVHEPEVVADVWAGGPVS